MESSFVTSKQSVVTLDEHVSLMLSSPNSVKHAAKTGTPNLSNCCTNANPNPLSHPVISTCLLVKFFNRFARKVFSINFSTVIIVNSIHTVVHNILLEQYYGTLCLLKSKFTRYNVRKTRLDIDSDTCSPSSSYMTWADPEILSFQTERHGDEVPKNPLRFTYKSTGNPLPLYM